MSSLGMPGGWTDEKPSDETVQGIVTQIKEALQTKTGKTYETFEAVKYRSQVVAGTNYVVKVKVGDGENDYVHVRIFAPLPGENKLPTLEGYVEDKKADDPLDYEI